MSDLMRRLALLFFAAIYFGCSSPSKQQQPQLTDEEAKEIIQTKWKDRRHFNVYLGTFEATKSEYNPSEHRLTKATVENYKTWEEAGFIRIKLKQDLTSGFSGWENWNKLWSEGVESVVEVEPTEKGKTLLVSEKEGPSMLRIPEGNFLVDKVVKNEPIRIGIYDYRVVFGTYTADYSPEAQMYYEKSKRVFGKDNKFKALLSFDPFKAEWSVITYDTSTLDNSFGSNSVDAWLKRLAEDMPALLGARSSEE
jgi:hypothetical protein